MATTRKPPPKERTASKPTPRQRKPKALRWQDVATYAVPKITANTRYGIRYGGKRGLDAASAMTPLDKELAREKIHYQARYLGIRDGRAVFDILIRLNYQHELAIKRAINQAGGVQLPSY